jgi:hypothetical protein
MLQKLQEIDETKIAAESRIYGMAENTAKYGWEARPVYIIHKGRYYSEGALLFGRQMKTLLPAYRLTQNRAKFLPHE